MERGGLDTTGRGTECRRRVPPSRHAQTAGYGVLPNAALPHTFAAQAYDLPDPWNTDPSCFFWGCCRANAGSSFSATKCADASAAIGGPRACAPYCSALEGTPAFTLGMGGLHSRNKQPIGQRLAAAAYRTVYEGERGRALECAPAPPRPPYLDPNKKNRSTSTGQKKN